MIPIRNRAGPKRWELNWESILHIVLYLLFLSFLAIYSLWKPKSYSTLHILSFFRIWLEHLIYSTCFQMGVGCWSAVCKWSSYKMWIVFIFWVTLLFRLNTIVFITRMIQYEKPYFIVFTRMGFLCSGCLFIKKTSN